MKDDVLKFPELKERTPREFNRLTMTSLIHHEQSGVPPSSVEGRSSFYLASREEPYQRRRVATTEWSFVDLGWLREETVACLVIENLEERDKGPNRVLDSIKDHRSKSLLVSYEANSSDCFFVFPAMFQPLFPSDPKRLMLRAAEGEVTYRIHAFPA